MANEGTTEPRREGDAIVLPDRIERLELQAAEAKERDEQYKQQQLTTNRNIAIFTGLLVLCTLATAGVGIWQARISNTAANAANEAAHAASDNANTAAYALIQNEQTSGYTLGQMAEQSDSQEKSANAAMDALLAVQRAFVFPVPNSLSVIKGDGGRVLVGVDWENSGSTPARDLRYVVNYFPKSSLPYSPKNLKYCDFVEQNFMPIGPKGKASFYSSEITQWEKCKALYVYGWAAYHDDFRNTREHVTRFCYEATIIDHASPKLIVDKSCSAYNCYDDKCKNEVKLERCDIPLPMPFEY